MSGSATIPRGLQDALGASWSRAVTVSDAIADTLVQASYRQRLSDPPAGWREIPLQVVGGVANRFRPPATPCRSTAAEPIRDIVNVSHAFLSAIPANGALLRSVVTHVVTHTGYDDLSVRAVILRHFRSSGPLVWV